MILTWSSRLVFTTRLRGREKSSINVKCVSSYVVGIDIDSWIGLSITMWTRLFLIGIVSEQVRKSRSHFEQIKKIGSEAPRSRRDQGISLVHDSKQVS